MAAIAFIEIMDNVRCERRRAGSAEPSPE